MQRKLRNPFRCRLAHSTCEHVFCLQRAADYHGEGGSMATCLSREQRSETPVAWWVKAPQLDTLTKIVSAKISLCRRRVLTEYAPALYLLRHLWEEQGHYRPYQWAIRYSKDAKLFRLLLRWGMCPSECLRRSVDESNLVGVEVALRELMRVKQWPRFARIVGKVLTAFEKRIRRGAEASSEVFAILDAMRVALDPIARARRQVRSRKLPDSNRRELAAILVAKDALDARCVAALR